MADVTLPYKPTWANPQPLVNKQEFVGSSGQAVRNLSGGSRFAWELIWSNFPSSKLWPVLTAATGAHVDDVLVLGLQTDLGKTQADVQLNLTKKGNVRSKTLEMRSGGVVPAGSVLGINNGFYQNVEEIPSGVSLVRLTFGLRKETPANSRVTVDNPMGRFIGLGEPPNIVFSSRNVINGEHHGSLSFTVVEE